MASPRTPEDFAEAFTQLLDVAGLSVPEVAARQLGVARNTLYDWQKGNHLPEGIGPLLSVVELCLDLAAERGADLGMVPCDTEEWLHLLAEAKQTRHSRVAGRLTSRADADPGGKRPDRVGQPVGRWGPVALGVHRTIGGEALTSYVRREHDDLLYAVLDPAVAANRMVVLLGDSSTGKSRAAYQAVAARLPHWPLFYPPTAAALSRLLEDGIPRRSVLWLNELRQYADDPAGVQPLSALAELLRGIDYVVAITTLWLDRWAAYTADHYGEPGIADPALATRDLLRSLPVLSNPTPRHLDVAQGGVIEVPDRFTGKQLALARRRGDVVLQEALAAAESAGTPGRLAQTLAGVPDLLNHFQGPGADPYGQALITAAMDAVRLGHTHLLGRELLQQAAVGYLAPRHRALAGEELATWQERAWKYATRTLKGAFQALEAVPPEQGIGVAGYRLADSLDQHGRHHRAHQIPPPAFWTAAAHAHPGDLKALGEAAWNRGLYRDAVRLHKNATAQGDSYAAEILIRHLHDLHPTDHHPAHWAASHASLQDPRAVAKLLSTLQETGADQQVTTLAKRTAAEVTLNDPRAVAELLVKLQDVGAHEQVTALAERAATHASLHDPHAAAELLSTLQETGADQQVTTLAKRTAAEVTLNDARAVAWLLAKLRHVGAQEQATTLAKRTAAEVTLNDPRAVAELLVKLQDVGAHEQVTALAERAATHASLHDPHAAAELLSTLQETGADQQVTTLAKRTAAEVTLNDARAVAWLLAKLRHVGAQEQATTLAKRAAALKDPRALAELLVRLREVGGQQQVAELLACDPAAQILLDDPRAVAELFVRLREIGADEQVTALVNRATAQVALDDPYAVARLLGMQGLVGAHEQVAELLARDPAAQVALNDPGGVALLLGRLWLVGAHEQVAELLARDPAAQVALNDPDAVAQLLAELWRVEAQEQATALAKRAAALKDPRALAELLVRLREVGGQQQVAELLACDPAAQVILDGPRAATLLLSRLWTVGAHEQVIALAERATTQVALDDPYAVARLLDKLREVGAQKQIAALAERAATQAALDDALGVSMLLGTLREFGAHEQAAVLAERAAAEVALDDPYAVARLLGTLRDVEAHEQVAVLAERLPAAGFFDLFIENGQSGERFRFGRELDGSAAAPWDWESK
ncbi:hypothetical protein ABT294_21010 [Nonomuraea sp. NPDC000554]|uniref:hypothetical protein n=1 Tax=Nonomuraea sp. NPDC000554 TaxID=3154259 RepID=UPI00331CB663